MIVEIDNIQKQEIINYGGIDFIISEVNLNRSIKNNESVENIKILQTNVAEDPILVNNQKYLLFLDEYEGPVASDVYVILGLLKGSKCHMNIFSDNALEAIINTSNGIPRTINKICNASLLIGHTKDVNEINNDIIMMAVNEIKLG